MRVIPLLICFLLMASGAAAQPIHVFQAGIGRLSCATAQQDARSEYEANVWMLGYWSGLNMLNEDNHVVGSTTDGAGILAEVQRVCAEAPSRSVSEATLRVYRQLEAERR